MRLLFHPSFHVPTLEASEEFFDTVFARPSTLLEVMPRNDGPRPPDAPKGYSKFTMIADVLIDSVCPTLHVTNGVQHFPSVDEPILQNFGWYCDDIDETFRALRRNGIPLVTQFGQQVDSDEPPNVGQGGAMKMFFTAPEQMGVRYQFLPWFPMPLDPRSNPDWALPAVSDDDPLAIVHCSHHVVLTAQPDRALRLMDALGGTVIHEGRDELRGISGPYVQLADAVFHYAVPDAGPSALAGRAPADKYHALTWKVADLDRAARHLESQGVKIAARGDDGFVTEASTSFNVPWGFTTRDVPGDTRTVGGRS